MRRTSPFNGVLVVDKCAGPTSHDVVAWARRALGVKAIGHTGTLDPVATGVLVLVVGEARKLSPYLTAERKVYDSTIRLGGETDSLDAAGSVVREAAVPPGLTRDRVVDVVHRFLGTTLQKPPARSAIKVGGKPLYKRVRAGEVVEPAEREVVVQSIDVREVGPDWIRLVLESGKGFYVRSLARDLALALGSVGYLGSLRRLRSGRFGVEGAIPADVLREAARTGQGRDEIVRQLISPFDACDMLPRARLTSKGVLYARQGRPISAELVDGPVERGNQAAVALASGSGGLVAIARQVGDSFRVIRGFREEPVRLVEKN